MSAMPTTIEVATILSQLRLDTACVTAGLVHGAAEDIEVSIGDAGTRFGKEVVQIVDGVTELGKVEFRSATEHQVENYRKMLLSDLALGTSGSDRAPWSIMWVENMRPGVA